MLFGRVADSRLTAQNISIDLRDEGIENVHIVKAALGLLRANAIATIIPVAGLLAACVGSDKADVAGAPGAAPVGGRAPQTDPGDDPSGTDPGRDTGGPGARAVSASLVTIRWQANSETDLAGYRVYRNEKPLATVDRNTVAYSDRDVLPATMYAYNLTAFDTAGNESLWSPVYRATTPPGTMPTLSFAIDVFPILQAHCSSCHAAYATLPTAYTVVTSLANGACAGQRLMIPGNASLSLLYQGVTGSQDCGAAPPSGPLASAQARIIGAWINQGGLNN